ncbi:protein archease-like [Actinia tenebrosa]|uniref:Protein archease-like n=1 Tax=Actinia tenebrosa TaxID=6105 RepID=A0A6P8J6C2_ACTTE|nr:protein archease-like [Actinia tenebrosa]
MAAVSNISKGIKKYEYLDHTADVQLHAWGDDLKEAFEQAVVAMFGYMTEIEKVDIEEEKTIEAEGDDMISLLFHFLDESLFLMCDDPYFIVKEVEITEFDKENFKIKAVERGEDFDLKKHPQGTEVKAITYSNMQIYDNEEKHEVFVIIDI